MNDCIVYLIVIIISFSDCRKTCRRPLIGRGTLNNNTCTCSCSFGMGPNCDGNSLIQYLCAIRIRHHNDTWYVHYHRAVRIVDLFMWCKSKYNPRILYIWICKVSVVFNIMPMPSFLNDQRFQKKNLKAKCNVIRRLLRFNLLLLLVSQESVRFYSIPFVFFKINILKTIAC